MILLFRNLTVDRKLRANLFAEVTGHAFRGAFYKRGMISLLIEFVRHLKNIGRAEFHAEATPLTSIFDDEYVSLWNLPVTCI